MSDARSWLLVAPWYRWRRQGVPDTRTPRATVPVIQKFESTDFVGEFLKDPQRSLQFVAPEDYVQHFEWLPKLKEVQRAGGRRRRVSERALVISETKKLYLDSHKRFYLVVCELHCDAPGFPSADRAEACETGFVVRRRRAVYPMTEERSAARALRGVSAASVRLAEIDRALRTTTVPNGNGSEHPPSTSPVDLSAEVFGIEEARREAVEDLLRERRELVAWAREAGATLLLEGWFAGGGDKVGAWDAVDGEPADLDETVFPLYPLIPDPRDAANAGRGSAIYFGVVPTGGVDHEKDGTARYDDRTLYEIRCFVRRHDARCPRTDQPHDCDGPVVWSGPTERYQLAPHFDLIGTSNLPITIQLPDIPTLETQAAGLRPGQGVGVRMATPPGSSFVFPSGSVPSSGSMGGARVCSFSIPLITIVATFVFNLFLPIVVFAFNLWFLLRLKFCLPPSAQVRAGVASELSILASAGVSADLDVTIDPDIDIDAVLTSAENIQLRLMIRSHLIAEGMPSSAADSMLADLATDPLIRLRQATAQAGVEPFTASATARLLWEPRASRPAVEILVR